MKTLEPRELSQAELEFVSGGGSVASGLAMGAGALSFAGVVSRFVPGAQVLSAGLTVLGIGTGLLAGVAAAYDL